MEDHLEKAEDIVQIDKLALDKECIRLPGDYLKFAHLSADAKRDLDDAENELKVISAEISRDIRANPEGFGLPKVSEDGIKSMTILQKNHQKALAQITELRHKSELYQGVVWALEHKKRSLTLLVELHGLGYFADVPMTREAKQSVDEMSKRRARRNRFED